MVRCLQFFTETSIRYEVHSIQNPTATHWTQYVIKQDNILINGERNAVLCDFGFSRIRHEVTRTHTMIREGGHLRYLAPELSSGPDKFRTSSSSDIYSLAMTFLALVTLTSPFMEIDREFEAANLARQGIRPRRPMKLNVPPVAEDLLWSLLDDMWQQEPDQRPNASSVYEALNKIFVEPGLSASPAPQSMGKGSRFTKLWENRSRYAAVLLMEASLVDNGSFNSPWSAGLSDLRPARAQVSTLQLESPQVWPVAPPESVQAMVAPMDAPIDQLLTEPILPSTPEAQPPRVEATNLPKSPNSLTSKCPATVGYDAVFVADTNAEDGHVFPAGAEFVKSWRLRNNGSVAWPESTVVAFMGGDRCGAAKSSPMEYHVGSVPAGAFADVHVEDMKAPSGGRYVSYWRLRDNATSQAFGNQLWCEYVP